MMWAKINKSFVKTEEDALVLSKWQRKYKAEFNTHTEKAMWFHFISEKDCYGFIKNVIKTIPYLTITVGKYSV